MPRSILFGVLGFAAGAAASAAVVIGLLPAAHEPAAIVSAPPAEGPAEPPAAPVAAPPAAAPCEVQAVAPRLPVAPPPHEAEPDEPWVYLGHSQRQASVARGEPWTAHGVEWLVKVGLRRLASTGRQVIDLHWSLRYVGPRPPLEIARPSITNSFPYGTAARIYAYPPGAEKGRRVVFTAPFDDRDFSHVINNGFPGEWFLTVPKGETATGTETVLVDDLKKELLTKYPAEFSAEKPPKLYAELYHKAWHRGLDYLDLWTGEIPSDHLEVPDLKTW